MVVLAVVASWYFGIHSLTSCSAYWQMYRAYHPIWKDLALRRIQAGRDVSEFAGSYPASWSWRHGAYTSMDFYDNYVPGRPVIYFSGITVIAKEGRLKCAVAWSSTWHHIFFDEFSKDEHKNYRESLRQYVDSLPRPPGEE